MRQEMASLFTSLVALGSSVFIGQRGLIHVWGRNDMTTTQLLGIHWVVRDPGGVVVEDYSDWSWLGAGPGVEHQFIGGRFDFDITGNWSIKIDLLMNKDAPVIVDSYGGLLCVVTGFAGTITRKELEYNETRGDIPVY